MQIGTLIRLENQSSTENLLALAIRHNLIEMYSLGYSLEYMLTAIGKLIRKSPKWKAQFDTLLQWLRRKQSFILCNHETLLQQIIEKDFERIKRKFCGCWSTRFRKPETSLSRHREEEKEQEQ